jgi:hypothetical protein
MQWAGVISRSLRSLARILRSQLEFTPPSAYGPLSQLLCVAGFLTVFNLVPWWGSEPMYFLGWLMALIILPFYVSEFSERIKAARLEAQQALKECLERDRRSD